MVDRRRNLGIPAGVVFQFGGTVAPYGYLMCDGREVLRSDYPALFAAIGTAHGIGNGTTTFNLPDSRYQVPRGRGGVSNRTFLPADVNISTEEIIITDHEYKRTGFRVRVSSTGTIVGGLAANIDYYVIIVNANTIRLATTRANALIGTAINLTSQGTGVHTIAQAEGADFASRTAVNGGNAGDNVGSLEEDAGQRLFGQVGNIRSADGILDAGTNGTVTGVFNQTGNATSFRLAGTSGNGRLLTFDSTGSARTSNETRSNSLLSNFIIKV